MLETESSGQIVRYILEMKHFGAKNVYEEVEFSLGWLAWVAGEDSGAGLLGMQLWCINHQLSDLGGTAT